MATESPVSNLQQRSASPSNPPASVRGPRNENEISLLDLLLVLAERKLTIFLVTVIIVVLAVIVSLVLPVRYTAIVALLPPQQNSPLSAQLAAQLGSMGGVASLAAGGGGLLKNPNDLYVAMLRSRTVEDAMVEHYGLMQEYHVAYLSYACKAFENRAAVDGTGKDGLIRISVDDKDARRAAELANGYVEQFRNLSQNLAITEAGQRRAFFEQQLKNANQNLANSEEALKVMEQKTGLIQLDSQTRALIESAAALRAQITAKEVQIQGMETYAAGQNAQLVQAQQELEGLRTQLTKLGGAGGESGGIIVGKGQMTEAGVEYVRKLRDVKYDETIFDILARQFELAKLDEAKEGALIQVVDPAVVPDRRSFPKRGLIVLTALPVGFFVGILVAFLLAGIQKIKENPESNRKLQLLRRAITARR